ncbi:MAG: glycosyltransferase [Clostridiales Family XIII bacterium]|jgi:glycosyltransferase involved in cell wall biosynthesis|nr:glycosyltransferase [Clostridiales Family XIII bacterium]
MDTHACPNPIVTIIVPVYNGARYLRRCIDSVFENRFESIELLLMDDGSTDGSRPIMDEYANACPGVVRAVSHENMGVARTRNRAIGLARGKYILFLDQDDWFDKDYIKTYVGEIEAHGCDVVIGGYKRPDGSGRVRKRKLLSGRGFYQYIIVYAWARIHRTEYLRGHSIEFFDNNIGEDVAFCFAEAAHSANMRYIRYDGYNWFFNAESVSEAKHKGLRDDVDIIPWMEKVTEFRFESAILREYCIVKLPIYYLLHSGRNASPKKFMAHYQELFKWVDAKFPGCKKNKYLLWGLPGERFPVKFGIAAFLAIRRLGLMGLFSKLYCSGRV